MSTVTATSETSRPARHVPQGGPPLWLLALVYGALMLAGVVLSAGTPQPSATAKAVLAYQHSHPGTLQLAAFFSFASAVPLAIWSATAYRRLRQLG